MACNNQNDLWLSKQCCSLLVSACCLVGNLGGRSWEDQLRSAIQDSNLGRFFVPNHCLCNSFVYFGLQRVQIQHIGSHWQAFIEARLAAKLNEMMHRKNSLLNLSERYSKKKEIL